MEKLSRRFRKFEFESRIFISMSIVLLVCLVNFLVFGSAQTNAVTFGNGLGLDPAVSKRAGFIVASTLMLLATFLRMWAGSILTSSRVMSFKVQKDQLNSTGPYLLVRNPIYLADLIAFCGFGLCLGPLGLSLPFLIYFHYRQLVGYEEESLGERFGEAFQAYKRRTPAFLPSVRSMKSFLAAEMKLKLNWDGIRHNSNYLLFIPGFIVASLTGALWHAVIIGVPGVIDWAVIHTLIGLDPDRKKKLSKSRVFRDILYAQCWEDPELDREAFRLNHRDVVFTITSGGCNALAYLLDNPRKIIALDLNPFQNYLLDLKIAAFRTLNYNELLAFFGARNSNGRLSLYRRIAIELNPESRAYWDNQPGKIQAGILHSGRYEKYMTLLSRWFRRLLGRSLIEDLLGTSDAKQREILLQSRLNTVRWRVFTRFFLSRFVMTFLFDKAFFKQLEEDFSFGKHFGSVVEKALIHLPLDRNNFLYYILNCGYGETGPLPVYLRPENYGTIRQRLSRIELVNSSCEEYFSTLGPDSISSFNFSNIFEWMSPGSFENLLRETVRIASNGAIITYRNLLVPRSRPVELQHMIHPLKDLACRLHERDLSFIYRAYIVEQITK